MKTVPATTIGDGDHCYSVGDVRTPKDLQTFFVYMLLLGCLVSEYTFRRSMLTF